MLGEDVHALRCHMEEEIKNTVRPKGWEKFTFDFNRNGCEFRQFSMDFPTIYVQVNTIKSIDLC